MLPITLKAGDEVIDFWWGWYGLVLLVLSTFKCDAPARCDALESITEGAGDGKRPFLSNPSLPQPAQTGG